LDVGISDFLEFEFADFGINVLFEIRFTAFRCGSADINAVPEPLCREFL
jgi:hypothetical protein